MALTKDLENFFRVMEANGVTQILRVDREYKFLEACSDVSMRAEDIAERCGTKVDPTRLVMEGLTAIGMATENSGRFNLTPLGALFAKTQQILGNRFWDHLPSYLKSGEPIIKMDISSHQAEHYQAEVGPLGWMLGPAAEEAAAILSRDNQKNLKILDLGAGSAVWSLAIAKKDKTSSITAVDWPQVLVVAQHMAKLEQLDSQLHLLPGDFHEIALPVDNFNLAILANITHLETPERNLHLFKRAYETLGVNGRILIIDVFPGLPEGDLARALYCIGLALRTEHGEVYSFEQLSNQLKEAGFKDPQLTLLNSPPAILGMISGNK